MGTYGQRLAEAMALARLTDRDARAKLAEAIGVSVQAIGQVLTAKPDKPRAFSAETSARAARFLRVDHFWLATGEGEPRPPGLSEDAKAFGLRYDRLNEHERAKFSAAIVIARDGVSDEKVEQGMPVTASKLKEKA